MARFIEKDEYSNGKTWSEIEFTTEETKEIIDLVQNPFIYCNIKLAYEQIDSLIADLEREKPGSPLIENLKVLKLQSYNWYASAGTSNL
jgi:hypothetical protein